MLGNHAHGGNSDTGSGRRDRRSSPPTTPSSTSEQRLRRSSSGGSLHRLSRQQHGNNSDVTSTPPHPFSMSSSSSSPRSADSSNRQRQQQQQQQQQLPTLPLHHSPSSPAAARGRSPSGVRRSGSGGGLGSSRRSRGRVAALAGGGGSSSPRGVGERSSGTSRRGMMWFAYVLLLCGILLYQASRSLPPPPPGHHASAADFLPPDLLTALKAASASASASASAGGTKGGAGFSGAGQYYDPHNPLAVPFGRAVPLPSVRVTGDADVAVAHRSGRYGGVGDKPHLGGFSRLDLAGVSPAVWKNMVSVYGVKSFLDVGCGRGLSTAWFLLHGASALCVDGSHDAVEQSVLPDPEKQMVEHDFTRGPWWPSDRTYDAVWAVEFLEHVNLQFQFHYLQAFRTAALVFASTARRGGWHHVEVHDDDWWITKFEAAGFRYSDRLTKQVREWAEQERDQNVTSVNGKDPYNAQNVWLTMKVFLNPVVSALPEHAHLFPERGCVQKGKLDPDKKVARRDCGTGQGKGLEIPLDPAMEPLPLHDDMDREWEALVQNKLRILGPAAASTAGTRRGGDAVEPAMSDLIKDVFPVSPEGVPAEADPSNLIKAVFPVDGQSSSQNDRTKNKSKKNQPGQPPQRLTGINIVEKDKKRTIPVVIWPYVDIGIGSAESQHVEENGVNESPFLRLSGDIYDFDPNVVWIGDTGYGYGWNLWCDAYHKVVVKAKERRKEQGQPTVWPVYIVDFTDQSSRQKCPQVEKEFPAGTVKYFARSFTKNRAWDNSTNWINFGFRMQDTYRGYKYRHLPLVVRTDTVAALKEVLEQNHKMKLRDPIERLPRPVDAVHFWPLDLHGVNKVYSELRTAVSRILTDLQAKRKDLNLFIGLKGDAVRVGRRNVKSEYIQALLESKIVVVTQRDYWEDHYRLFEAMISGTMVMTDRMLALPGGLENGTSIVEFSTPENLVSLLLYYLEHPEQRMAIARRGRYIAMQRHRTWHRMEEVIFGNVLSTCESNVTAADCPFTVHASS